MSAPDAQPPAMWWSAKYNAVVVEQPCDKAPDLIKVAALPADAVRLVALVEDCAAILDDPDGVTAYVCTKTARHTGSTREQCHDDGDGTQWWGGKESVIRPAVPASAALAGTTTPTDDRRLLEAMVTRIHRVLDRCDQIETGSRGYAHVLSTREVRALLASAPTEETDHG